MLTKPCLEHIAGRVLKNTQTQSKHIVVASLLSMVFVSGCSTIGQKVADAAEALKTDVQTQHDENFRLKRVRKALLVGDIALAEEHRDSLYASHWRCIANIEISAAKYPHKKQQALEMISQTSEEIWNILDANKRAMALIALLKFELETRKDTHQAKEIIEQAEKTIAFILDDHARKMRRYRELQTLVEKHNHLLSR